MFDVYREEVLKVEESKKKDFQEKQEELRPLRQERDELKK